MLLRQPSPWPELFRETTREAFHLEVRDTYHVASEAESLRRFLNGEPPLLEYAERPWTKLVRQTVGRGVRVTRVRVVTVPHSDYQRWLLSITADNVAAGEDIRYLPRHTAGEIPPDDWWLFDDTTVGFNLVDEDGKPAGAAITTDPGIAAYCQRVKQRLWRLAVPFTEYVTDDAVDPAR
ncbi:hypothetical protein IU474_18870 [Nocardia otitidiscaviarum]|uniref:DUF6879 family protein n=1 Tax=Nocardia otitidiscaviarum TaxID=1823 RepID=UPI001893D8AD|nr:DUF6879 family protein [Nocardia otitidiscaviarum]MBF6239116.1 hypothetical protein [Nocardia otitidiscaviarum]